MILTNTTQKQFKQIVNRAAVNAARMQRETLVKFTSEHQVQSQVIGYLSYQGFMVWRNNTGMIPMDYKGKKRLVRFGKTGSGDVFAIKGGKFYSIEVKSPTGHTTEAQELWMEDVRLHGGNAFVVRSLDELIEQLKS